MYSKGECLVKTAGCILLFTSGIFLSVNLFAQEKNKMEASTLNLVPNKCIALRKGRKCFATIKVNWQTEITGRYCLRRVSDQLEINCWEAEKTGSFSYIFSSSIDEYLELINANDEQVIVTSKVKVSWVYNSNKRRKRWRVF